MKAFLVVALLGLAMTFVGMYLRTTTQPSGYPTAAEAASGQRPGAWRGELATVLRWLGVAMICVGSIGLTLCGVSRYGLTGGAFHD